jgi:hypothetical protein
MKGNQVSNHQTGTAVIPWEEQLAAMAQAEAKTEKVGNNFFSFKGGKIAFMGEDLGNSMDVVVMGSIYDRAFYPGIYGEAKTPVCYSYSRDGIGMTPHADVKDQQAESCDACPQNQFGSAKVGKGKACREYRRIALISAANLQAEEVSDAIVGIAKIPPTSSKNYSEYVRKVAEKHNRPLWAVITTMTVLPDPNKQVVVTFKDSAPLSQEVAQAVFARDAAIRELLNAPYPVFEDEKVVEKAVTKPVKFGVKK